MTLLELNDLFNEKLAKVEIDDEEYLDTQHAFLKMALSFTVSPSDPVVGLMEIPNSKMRIDGYFIDEDKKEIHVLSLCYFDNIAVDEETIKGAVQQRTAEANRLIAESLKKSSSIGTNTQAGEAILEIKETLENEKNFEICLDMFSNVDFPENLRNTTNVNLVNIAICYFSASDIATGISERESNTERIDFLTKYNSPLKAIRIESNPSFDIYLTSISGKVLSDVYLDHKDALMDGNVRAYLKKTQKVNKGIAQTLKERPSEFAAYNNGLSTVAESDGSWIFPIGDSGLFQINSLAKFQIVNGGQTTVTIYVSSKESSITSKELEDTIVPVKISVLKTSEEEADLVTNIAVFANTQTAIAKSDLASNKPFYKALESYSRDNPCYKGSSKNESDMYYWFFERTNGLYNTRRRIVWNYSSSFDRRYPEKKKFSKKIMAKAINAFEQFPDIVCKGNEYSFAFFDKKIEEMGTEASSEYFRNVVSLLILWQAADKIIKKLGFPIKAAVLPYSIALISFRTRKLLDLNWIWENQSLYPALEGTIRQAATLVNNHFQSMLGTEPNTLMYGRKPECWKRIKNECTLVAPNVFFTSKPTSMYPENPAMEYIQKNMDNVFVWDKLCFSGEKYLNDYDKKAIGGFRSQINYSALKRIEPQSCRKKAVSIFMKAVKNGYKY